MTKNMGTLDRSLRVTAAILVGVFYMTGQLSGVAALILGVIAVAFLATSTVGSCPIYLPFGLSTRRGESAKA
jgi:Na+(H+)/acetate symporter ActP